MTRVASVALAVFALGWPVPAWAQATLSLEQVVQQTLERNRSLEARRAESREADARASQARAGLFPRVSFIESWQRTNQPVFAFSSLLSARRFAQSNFAIDALNSPDPLGLFHGAVSIEQTLFDGGRTLASVSSASLGRDIAIQAEADAAGRLALTATETYGRLLAALAAGRAAAGAVAAADQDLARAERRRDAGTATDADVLAMSVHLATVRQRQIQVEGAAAVARAELNRLMGAPIDRVFDAQEPTAASGASISTTSIPALIAEAEASRPDLLRAAATERLADAGRRLARASWYPQVAARAGYEVNGTRLADRAAAWVVGGELRWNLSTGGAERAGRTAAAEAAVRAQAEREDARSAAHVEIVVALQRLGSARARQAIGQAAVDHARESQRIVRDRFDAGLASANDVLRASSALLDADAERVAAIVDAIVGNAMLGRAVGRKP